MKNLLFSLLILLSMSSYSQDSLIFSGSASIVSYSQGGGAELDYIYYMPMPYHCTFFITRIDHPDSIPVVVARIETDSNGTFSFKLPPGKYGFTDNPAFLTPGQFYPHEFESYSGHMHSYQGWGSSIAMPLDLKEDIHFLELTYYNTSACMDCP